VARGGPDIGPTLAVAPDGTVLMVFKTESNPQVFSVAWRRAGHRFAKPSVLSRSQHAPNVDQPVHAAFDAQGTASVWGSCTASVLSAPAGTRRFGRPIVLARGVLGFSLATSGSGNGLASWVSGHCSTGVMDGDVYGPVRASVLRAGRFAEPVAVSPTGTLATGTRAIALPGGDGLVVYGTPAGIPAPSASATYAVELSDGLFAAPVDVGSVVPQAATPAGDLVLTDTGAGGSARALVRPAGGGPDDAVALAGPVATVAVPASGRRAAAALSTTDAPGTARLHLAVWRP
jgi:hypothetical protein